MQQLPESLRPLAAFKQFLLYELRPDPVKGSTQKMPIDPRTLSPYEKGSDWQNDPGATVSADEAIKLCGLCGPNYGVGFLFKESDPFFFVDLDKCLEPSGWTTLARDIMDRLRGAAVEVSQSGTGLHIFGTGKPPAEHAKKNTALGLEFYTERRFVALTGTNIVGDASVDCSAALPALVRDYFAPSVASQGEEWREEPVDGYRGPEDDDELIEKMLGSQSGASVFGGGGSFPALWAGDEAALAQLYPSDDGFRSYDGSSADAALAQHLAFWTGNHSERILRLMQRSGLVRDKWDREDYLPRTITRATSLQSQFYAVADNSAADALGAGPINAKSPAQQTYAENVRADKLAQATPEEAAKLAEQTSASFWIDGKDKTPGELADAQLLSGYQFLPATQQIEYFAGCVYVQDSHKIFTLRGSLLKPEQFNATFGGYVFQLDDNADKTTRKAFEAFTESQAVRFPKVESTCFRPELQPGIVIEEEGRSLVNTYVPIETPKQPGDPSPFLTHLEKLLPVQSDREILLAYMAACVQHKGVKFQWAPLIQGAEGNGKTLFTRCVAFAIGSRYTHLPPALEISEKFNEWLFNKIFIGIEDVYVPDHKREIIEVLKPMITNDKLAMRAMQASQVMGDNRANFMLNSNHKDAWRKTENDRRIAVFFTAQQSAEHIKRDGLDGDYFPELYKWLRAGGYAIVASFLSSYDIPEALNPAGASHRAPQTSSTLEAVSVSLGGIEQEVLEKIDEGVPGFAGGWVSSVALDRLLSDLRAGAKVPIQRRRELMQTLGYDWHPALKDGRVNNPLAMDGNKKPRIYIKRGHLARNLTSPAEVAKAYEQAQAAAAQMQGAEVAAGVFGF